MEFTPELSKALDIVADEVTCPDENDRIIEIVCSDDKKREILERLFFDIVNVEFFLWGWVRNLVKYGDMCLFVDAAEQHGILNLLPIPINEIERDEGFDKKDPFAVRFRWLTQGNMVLEAWQVIHFRLLGNDAFLPYGQSFIEPARRIWRQLILIEDAMLVYRIVRSPERRVFKIDVGNIPQEEVERFVEEVKNKMKRSQIVDPATGRVDLRHNALDMLDDYFLPVRGDHGPSIDTLPGGQFVGDIDDVQYIQNKLFAALGIPKAWLSYESDIGSKATLAALDVRFAKTTQRIQKCVVAELNKIAIVHLYLLGYRDRDLVDFEIKMANPSSIAEQQRLEIWRMRFEVAGMAQEGIFDRETIQRTIFNLKDRQIAKIREGRRLDKLEDQTLASIESGASAAPPPPPPGEGGAPPPPPAPGEEELPKTLGGPPENASVSLVGQILGEEPDEKRNPGSEGDDAFVAVDKGRDLFSMGDDQHTSVFGTDKQTASDPYDRRAMRRMVTRPFGEGNRDQVPREFPVLPDEPPGVEPEPQQTRQNDVAEWLVRSIDRTSVIAEGLRSAVRDPKKHR